MNTFPFTNVGAQQLIEELYDLPQPQLQIEADAAGDDFPAWLQSHFDLSPSQVQYLEQIDQAWIDNAAAETKHALENRLPVELNKQENTSGEDEEEDRGKLLDLDKDKKSSFSQENGFIENETLTFTISYPAN